MSFSGNLKRRGIRTDGQHVTLPYGEFVVNGTINYGTAAGTTDAYAITIADISAYTTGMMVLFYAATANTGACSLNINSLGAKSLKSLHDTDPLDSYIEAGSLVLVAYDGTNFQILSPDANP